MTMITECFRSEDKDSQTRAQDVPALGCDCVVQRKKDERSVNMEWFKKILYVLGGVLLMANMVGCDDQTSKAYMDNKFADLSRVYPTEDLADLFLEFPSGFWISHNRTFKRDGERLQLAVEVAGHPSTREIKGKATLSDASGDEVTYPVIEEVRIRYEQGQLVAEDSIEYLNEYLPEFRFMFQEVVLNREVLQQLKMISAGTNQNGSYRASYEIENEHAQKILNLSNYKLRLSLGITNVFEKKGQYFREIAFRELSDDEKRSSINEYISDEYTEVK